MARSETGNSLGRFIGRIGPSDAINNPRETQIPQLSARTLEQSFQTIQPFEDNANLPERFAMADAISPYLKSQKFVVNEDDDTEPSATDLENIGRLHSAQLKLLLLFYPEMATEIQSALGKASL